VPAVAIVVVAAVVVIVVIVEVVMIVVVVVFFLLFEIPVAEIGFKNWHVLVYVTCVRHICRTGQIV
jgi:hypothetical protein